jgi:hypothetical protein
VFIFLNGCPLTLQVWFDPHATSLPGVNPANPGKMIDFRKNSALLAKVTLLLKQSILFSN